LPLSDVIFVKLVNPRNIHVLFNSIFTSQYPFRVNETVTTRRSWRVRRCHRNKRSSSPLLRRRSSRFPRTISSAPTWRSSTCRRGSQCRLPDGQCPNKLDRICWRAGRGRSNLASWRPRGRCRNPSGSVLARQCTCPQTLRQIFQALPVANVIKLLKCVTL